jgi:hypothetical protein
VVASIPVLGKHKALLKGRKPSVELIPLAKVLCAAVFEVAKFFFLPFGRGAMLSVRKRWLFHASHPHLPIHALLSVPSVLIYNTREAPYVRHLVA